MRARVRGAAVGLLCLSASVVACTQGEVGPAVHVEDLPELVLEEELRIGSLDDPDVGFTSIGDIWVSPTGELYVSERRELEIRVYDTDGRLLRTYGRAGEGPGEFGSIGWFGVVGDTLWVSDGALNRTSIFHVDGTLAGTVTALLEVPVGAFLGRPATVRVFPHALRSDGLIESIFVRAVRPNLPREIVEVPRVLFDRHGNVVDTLEVVETRVSRPARMLRLGRAMTAIYTEAPVPDSGTSRLELDSGSFAMHWFVEEATGFLEVVRRGPDGRAIFESVMRYDPRPVTAHYLDSVAGFRARRYGSRSDSLTVFEAYRAAMQRPPHHVPVQQPFMVGEASIWTRLDPDDPSSSRFLVFRENEATLATVTLPPGAHPHWNAGDRLWLVERDDLGVPWVVRYRIRGP